MELGNSVNKLNQENQGDNTNKQTSGRLGKKIIIGICAVPMILYNISLNAVASVGRRAWDLLWVVTRGLVVSACLAAFGGFFVPMALVEPKSRIGKALCYLAGLVSGIVIGSIAMIGAIYAGAVEILKTPILLLVSAGAWIYNGLVGYVRLFKNVGKDKIFVSDRYQNLGSDLKAQKKLSIIEKLANVIVPDKPEKAQKVNSTRAAVGYTFGFYDIKSKDEVKGKKSPKLLTDNVEEDEEQDTEDTEYVVKPKSFPHRTGGYMIY